MTAEFPDTTVTTARPSHVPSHVVNKDPPLLALQKNSARSPSDSSKGARSSRKPIHMRQQPKFKMLESYRSPMESSPMTPSGIYVKPPTRGDSDKSSQVNLGEIAKPPIDLSV